MIPVAAVARPRQGIRVPVTGAPPLSAGTIVATAGNGQVVIAQGVAPQGGAGAHTRQLYRSTTPGTPGSPVQGATSLPFTDSGVANATTYYYTLRVSDGASAADTGQVSATPQATSSVLLVGHDFDDGLWAPFNTPGRGNPADYSIIDDPTGSGRGKVAAIHYHRTSTSDPELDKNRAFKPSDHTPGLTGPDGMTFGSRGYFRGDVYVPNGTTSGFAPEFDLRKLIYPKFGDWNSGALRHHWILTLNGRTNGSGMDLGVTSGTSRDRYAGYPEYYHTEYGVAAFNWSQWYLVEVEWQINTAGAADGWLKVWIDGVQKYERTGFMLAAPHPTDPETYFYLYEFEIGDQQQGSTSTPNSLFDSYRYWDNVQLRTRRP